MSKCGMLPDAAVQRSSMLSVAHDTIDRTCAVMSAGGHTSYSRWPVKHISHHLVAPFLK